VLELYGDWADTILEHHPNMSRPTIIKPVLNMFMGCKNSAKYRQYLSEVQNYKQNKDISELFQ
jgi:hypothetical protein